jgi:hypothetical protein
LDAVVLAVVEAVAATDRVVGETVFTTGCVTRVAVPATAELADVSALVAGAVVFWTVVATAEVAGATVFTTG